MGMSHGSSQEFDKVFGEKAGCTITKMDQTVIMTFQDVGSVQLTSVQGDCTAAVLYTGMHHKDEFYKILPTVLAYLSAQGRISVFMSRKVPESYVKAEMERLSEFVTEGMHVQRSNRSFSTECVQLTCLLKITNPYVSGSYHTCTGVDAEKCLKHMHFDVSTYNELNERIFN